MRADWNDGVELQATFLRNGITKVGIREFIITTFVDKEILILNPFHRVFVKSPSFPERSNFEGFLVGVDV